MNLRILLLLSILVTSAGAQTVLITGTVVDPNGNPYQNGSGVVTLVPQNQQWLVNGTNPVPTPIAIASLDSFGHFSVSLTNSSLISPQSPLPQWQFSFCSSLAISSPPICFTMTPLYLSSSQDISALIQPQAATLPVTGGGGNTFKVNGTPLIGSPTTINFIASTNMTIVDSGLGSITFSAAGGGGGGTPGGVDQQCQFNNASSFGGAFNCTFNTTTGQTNIANLNKIRTPSPVPGTTYNYLQSPSDSLIVAGAGKTVTLSCSVAAPCIGIDISNTATKPYYTYVSTVGTPEAALVTGGTCPLFSTANCTIIITTVNSHSNGYTVQSAYSGIQEAINDAATPDAKIVLQPVGANANAYQIFAPIYFQSLRSVLDGEGSYIKCFTRSMCLFLGDPTSANIVLDARVHSLRLASGINIAGVGISNTSQTGCPGAGTCQINITTSAAHPFVVGDYVDIQGTFNTAYWGVWKITSSADNTHFVALYASQINVPAPAVNIGSAASAGQVALFNAGIVDNAAGSVMEEIQFESGSAAPGATGLFHNGIVVFNDQAAEIDNPDMNSGSIFRCDSTYCANAIYAPGPFSINSAVISVHGRQISLSCHGNGITDYSGNSLNVSDIVIQGYGQWAINNSTIRGGFGKLVASGVYNEVGVCSNPLYSGSSTAARAEAGIIGGGSVRGNEFPVGNAPQFDCVGSAGANYLYYWIIIKDSVLGTSAPLWAGNTLNTCSGNATVQWPRVQGTNTITYDIVRVGLTGGGAVTGPFIGGCTGGSVLACGSVATAQAQCSTQVCSFTDDSAANTSSYALISPTYFPELYFWPGAAVVGPNNDTTTISNVPALYMDSTGILTGRSQLISDTAWLAPTFHVHECVNATPGSWISCLAENSAGNSALGATVLQGGFTNAGMTTGLKGRVITEWGSGVPQGALETLVDSNPSATWASPIKRAAISTSDVWIGSDTVGGSSATNAPLTFHSPLSISNYINSLDDGANWGERLTASKKEFHTPMQVDSSMTLLGTCFGCGPFVPVNPAADDFNRADGAVGANWTVTDGTLSISSNRAVYTFGGDSRMMAVYSAISFGNDQCSQVIIDTISSADIGPVVRGSTVAETGYFYDGTASTSVIGKVVAGVRSTLIGSGPLFAPGDIAKVCVKGTTLTAYKNNVQTLTTTDATIASGNPGLWAENQITGKFDFWSGGDYAYAATATINVVNANCTGTCAGFGGTGTVTASGALVNTAIATGAGTTVVTTPSATTTLDASGNISTPGTITSTATNGGISGPEGNGSAICTPASGTDCLWMDSAFHRWMVNMNNGGNLPAGTWAVVSTGGMQVGSSTAVNGINKEAVVAGNTTTPGVLTESSAGVTSWTPLNTLSSSPLVNTCGGTVGAANGAAYIFYPSVLSTTTCTATAGTAGSLPIPVGKAGTADTLSVVAGTACASAGTAVTLYVNNSPTALTVTGLNASSGTVLRDTTHSVSLAATDSYAIRVVTGQATETCADLKATFYIHQ